MKNKRLDRYIESLSRLDGKEVIVTGANTGLGFEMCKVLASKGADIVMACRDVKKAEEARDHIMDNYPYCKISIEEYDQADGESITKFADTIIKSHPNFYGLILNAGILRPNKDSETKHGFPLTSGTNFFGVLLLLDKLDEFIQKTKEEKRIVIHGSCVMYNCKFKSIEESLLNNNLGLYKQYKLSKLAVANIYDYYATKNENPNVKYLLAEPGIARSNITRYYKQFVKTAWNSIVGFVFNDSVEGCLACARLVCDEINNGDYFRPRGILGYRGLPRKAEFIERLYIEGLIEDSKKIIYERLG